MKRTILWLIAALIVTVSCQPAPTPTAVPPTSTPLPAPPTVAPTSPPAPTSTALPTSAPIPTATVADLKLVSDGRERSYRLFRPGNIDAKNPPLVIFLHGSGSTGKRVAPETGLDDESEHRQFIVVYPDATTSDQQWNAGICCGAAVSEGVDDVAFISRLMDRLSSEFHVDPNRIYVWGFSNGGMLAYRIACEMSERIAAIASSSGPLVVAQCQPVRPVSVVHFHGLADSRSPYNGGMRVGPPNFVQLAIPTIIDRWRELDGCSAPPVVEKTGSLTESSSKGCRDGTEVTLFTAEQGTHSVNPLGGTSANVTQLVLDFFAAHPKGP